LAELKPHPRNPNKHPEEQIKLLAKIIRAQGWRNPIVVSNRSGLITKGHARLSAARLLGTVTAPIDRQDYASESEELADMIADNRIAELAETDQAMLRALAEQLDDGAFDMDLTGFDQRALEELMTAARSDVDAEPQTDKAEELAAKWKVERGQIWQLGAHRIMCGDSNSKDFSDLINGEKDMACVTDPPYGVDWNTDYTRFTSGDRHTKIKYKPIKGDQKEFDPRPWIKFEKVVLWGANLFAQKLPRGSWIVWDKREENGTAWLADGEVAWMKGGYGVYICPHTGPIREGRGSHPTQKRTDVVAWTIEKIGVPPSVVDPFVGSGTTIMACEQLRVKCSAMDIEPGYVAVAIQRWTDATGKTPKLLNGKTK